MEMEFLPAPLANVTASKRVEGGIVDSVLGAGEDCDPKRKNTLTCLQPGNLRYDENFAAFPTNLCKTIK
jgi:hypothetical protein